MEHVGVWVLRYEGYEVLWLPPLVDAVPERENGVFSASEEEGEPHCGTMIGEARESCIVSIARCS